MPYPPFDIEHDQVRETVRAFCKQELGPYAAEWDKAGEFPREVFHKLAEHGLIGIRYDEEVGGQEMDWWANVAYMEELVHTRSGGVTMSVLVNSDMATGVIHEVGTPEQRKEFLTPLCAGEAIFALGVTEPGCGSDVAALRTTARRDGDDFVINGAKTFITNGSFADYITLCVRTGDEGHMGISLIVMPTDVKGFTVGRKLDKLGTRAVDSSELHFDNCRVPARNLLGVENMGFIYLMNNFQGERVAGSVMAYSGMTQSIRDAIRYGRERQAFGRPIIKFQWWRHKFAEHLAAIEAGKQLTYQAVQKLVDGENPTREVSMAKLFCGELSQKVAYDCMQFHGGYGFIEEYDVCRNYRDSRLITIGGGTSEVMREIIAKLEGM